MSLIWIRLVPFVIIIFLMFAWNMRNNVSIQEETDSLTIYSEILEEEEEGSPVETNHSEISQITATLIIEKEPVITRKESKEKVNESKVILKKKQERNSQQKELKQCNGVLADYPYTDVESYLEYCRKEIEKNNHDYESKLNILAFNPLEGFGNRMRAMISAFVFAMLTKRIFMIDWYRPHSWDLIFKNPLPYNWDLQPLVENLNKRNKFFSVHTIWYYFYLLSDKFNSLDSVWNVCIRDPVSNIWRNTIIPTYTLTALLESSLAGSKDMPQAGARFSFIGNKVSEDYNMYKRDYDYLGHKSGIEAVHIFRLLSPMDFFSHMIQNVHLFPAISCLFGESLLKRSDFVSKHVPTIGKLFNNNLNDMLDETNNLDWNMRKLVSDYFENAHSIFSRLKSNSELDFGLEVRRKLLLLLFVPSDKVNDVVKTNLNEAGKYDTCVQVRSLLISKERVLKFLHTKPLFAGKTSFFISGDEIESRSWIADSLRKSGNAAVSYIESPPVHSNIDMFKIPRAFNNYFSHLALVAEIVISGYYCSYLVMTHDSSFSLLMGILFSKFSNKMDYMCNDDSGCK